MARGDRLAALADPAGAVWPMAGRGSGTARSLEVSDHYMELARLRRQARLHRHLGQTGALLILWQ